LSLELSPPSCHFTLFSTIPETVEGKWYGGNVMVGLKDSIVQPSNPFRHAAELNTNLTTQKLDEKPILLVFTDGGPDHNIKNSGTILSWLSVADTKDLDYLCVVRTAPHNSWHNYVERVMSGLNLGLQGVALCRDLMADKFEHLVGKASGMDAIRSSMVANPALVPAWNASMARPITIITERFNRLFWSELPVAVYPSLPDSCVTDLRVGLQTLLEVPDVLALTKQSLLKPAAHPILEAILTNHCIMGSYFFQFCKVPNCTCMACDLGVIKPGRLSDEELKNLHFIPCPMLNPCDKEHFLPFDQLFGTDTSEKDSPPTGSKVRADVPCGKQTQKVRATITCHSCSKPRVLYSEKSLTRAQLVALEAYKAETLFSCDGGALFEEGHPLLGVVFAQMGVGCDTFVETQYYSSKKFDDVCVRCGSGADLAEAPETALAKYTSVRPLCQSCLEAGTTWDSEGVFWGVKGGKKGTKKARIA
jgi:hypothetical protein